MSGGEISSNNADDGGGVYFGASLATSGEENTFTMSGGKISGNNTYNGGGGVGVSGKFFMESGEISGNSAGSGGGVVVSNGIFTMSGGEISGNTASGSGGGIYISASRSNYAGFTKTGGTITGYASDTLNGNVVIDNSGIVQDDRGHAVYAYRNNSILKRKETTAGPSVNLSWIDSTFNTSSGDWDY
jgi:parallel beta-helix repeat protein